MKPVKEACLTFHTDRQAWIYGITRKTRKARKNDASYESPNYFNYIPKGKNERTYTKYRGFATISVVE